MRNSPQTHSKNSMGKSVSVGQQNKICACSNFINPLRLVQKLKFCRILTLLSNIGKNPISAVTAHNYRNRPVNCLWNTFSNHVTILLLRSCGNQIQTVLSNRQKSNSGTFIKQLWETNPGPFIKIFM